MTSNKCSICGVPYEMGRDVDDDNNIASWTAQCDCDERARLVGELEVVVNGCRVIQRIDLPIILTPFALAVLSHDRIRNTGSDSSNVYAWNVADYIKPGCRPGRWTSERYSTFGNEFETNEPPAQ